MIASYDVLVNTRWEAPQIRTAEIQGGVWHIRRSLELCTGLNDGRQRNISCIQNIQRETCYILTPKEHLRMLLTVVWKADKGRTDKLWWSSLPTLKQTRVIPIQSTCYQHKSYTPSKHKFWFHQKNDLALVSISQKYNDLAKDEIWKPFVRILCPVLNLPN